MDKVKRFLEVKKELAALGERMDKLNGEYDTLKSSLLGHNKYAVVIYKGEKLFTLARAGRRSTRWSELATHYLPGTIIKKGLRLFSTFSTYIRCDKYVPIEERG